MFSAWVVIFIVSFVADIKKSESIVEKSYEEYNNCYKQGVDLQMLFYIAIACD